MGPLSEYLSLKPKHPPPQPQILPFISIAKLRENPQAISINLGRGSDSRLYFKYLGCKTALQ